MTEYLICVLIMTLIEVNENHLKSIRDMDGVPNYDFGIFQTWVGILIRLIIWIIPGSILLYFLFVLPVQVVLNQPMSCQIFITIIIL